MLFKLYLPIYRYIISMILTYKYRIKDATSRKALCALSGKVNYVWNYVNEINKKSYVNYKQGSKSRFLSAFDINNLLKGTSKELGLHSQTIQNISESYVSNRKTNKKSWLNWRSKKRSLGWIPFKASGFEWRNDKVIYQCKSYNIYLDRKLPEDAVIKTGSFNQDSCGRWFVNITFDTTSSAKHLMSNTSIGIDLGVKEVLTLSNGTSFHRSNSTKQYEAKLALAQRANKKRQICKLHSRVKNTRKDYYHKITSQIAKQFETIFIGDVKSQDIIDKSITNLTKGVYDASWFQIKNLLEYKANKLGGFYREVKESYTTQDCSSCRARCGPCGDKGLSIREWVCAQCGVSHRRDVNAAKNILRIGHNTLSKAKVLQRKPTA